MTNLTRRRLLRVGRVDQQPQTLQARVDVFIRVIVRTSGEFQAADDAQARTILAANGGDRLSQSDGVTNHSVEIQLVVVCQPQHISVVFRFDRHAAPEIQTRQCLVVQLDLHRTIDVAQAAAGAKVVINARTGSVVMNQSVRINDCAVAHGSLSVVINTKPVTSQPNALSGGTTVLTERSQIEINQDAGALQILRAGASLVEVIKGLNALGANPQDLVSILQAMKTVGALRAELEII